MSWKQNNSHKYELKTKQFSQIWVEKHTIVVNMSLETEQLSWIWVENRTIVMDMSWKQNNCHKYELIFNIDEEEYSNNLSGTILSNAGMHGQAEVKQLIYK